MELANVQGMLTQTRSFQPALDGRSSEPESVAPNLCPKDSFSWSSSLPQEQDLTLSPGRINFGENAHQAQFANPASGPASLASLEAQVGDLINVREKEWLVSEILRRYEDLVLKSKPMSAEERNKKIALFQSLPLGHRTPEFIKTWASLSLEEAKEVVGNLRKKQAPWSLRQLFSRAA